MTDPSPSTGRALPALIGLNVALVAAVAALGFADRTAVAQSEAGTTTSAAPRYVMLAAETDGPDDPALVYIIDQTTNVMVPIAFDHGNERLSILPASRIGNPADIPAGTDAERPGRRDGGAYRR